jgi:hypothetical protein
MYSNFNLEISSIPMDFQEASYSRGAGSQDKLEVRKSGKQED